MTSKQMPSPTAPGMGQESSHVASEQMVLPVCDCSEPLPVDFRQRCRRQSRYLHPRCWSRCYFTLLCYL